MGKLRFFTAGIMVFLLAGCSRPQMANMPSRTDFVLATLCTITLYDYGKPEIYQEIFDRLREIENRMSAYLEGTDVDRINKAAGITAVQVSPDVFDVIERAVHFAELSGGAFDPTVEPLVKLWDIGGNSPRVPAQEEIDRVLPLINWRDIELNHENKTVFLKRPGMALDLGAIAKGYAADEAAAIIKQHRIPQAMINLGGNVLTVGMKSDGTLWRIGIQDPLDSRGAYIGVVQTTGKTVVTSGVYERYFTANGVHYHHLFDPSLGYPARSGLLSATIITDVSMDADALSTVIFVLGYEQGRALLESLEGVEAIFVFSDRSIRLTGGIDFTLTDQNYRLVRD
jgi:thiamine biosynthesis lipoprotein